MLTARIATLSAMLCMVSCGIADEPSRLHTTHAPPVASGGVKIVERTPLLPTFPCSRCHDQRPIDKHERKLTQFHTERILNHGHEGGWCYRCHTEGDIDHLHLPDGKRVSFNEAYELCGSCHGDKYRDWRDGIHGLTTGFWLGERERRSCPQCHDPHLPGFPKMVPERPPQLPRAVAEELHGARPEGAKEESNADEH